MARAEVLFSPRTNERSHVASWVAIAAAVGGGFASHHLGLAESRVQLRAEEAAEYFGPEVIDAGRHVLRFGINCCIALVSGVSAEQIYTRTADSLNTRLSDRMKVRVTETALTLQRLRVYPT